jgi:hypothetical protein
MLINFLTTEFILIISVYVLAYSSGYTMSYRSLKLVEFEKKVVAEYVKNPRKTSISTFLPTTFFKLDQFYRAIAQCVARRIG